MTTKEQERKALAQIRKIVESLGDDSYVGTAFEGCFEIAETNIQNDWACSMKQRAEEAEKKLEKIGGERLIQRNVQLANDLEQMRKEKFEAENELGCRGSEIVDLKNEIVKLKARLFDLIDK